MEALDELIQFLNPQSDRLDLKTVAMQSVLGLTANEHGLQTLAAKPHLLAHLLALMRDTSESVAKDAGLAVINLSASPAGADALLKESAVARLWAARENKECGVAAPACMALCNLSIQRDRCDAVAEQLSRAGATLEKLVLVFCREGYNVKGAKLHYLGPLLSNLTQLRWVRDEVADPERCVAQRLLPFTTYEASRVRRGGAVGALRNLCFDGDRHAWLLGDEVDVLPRLLLPLAGPTPEALDAEDVEKLPLDLQYLDEDKKVEEDPDLRRMLLEAVLQLCATRAGRESIRARGAYFVVRELHKDEQDRAVRLAAENLADLLIKKESEIGRDDLKAVEVPADVVPELEAMDKEYLKE